MSNNFDMVDEDESTASFVLDIFQSFCKRHPWLVAFNCLFMLLIPVSAVLLPRLYGHAIETIQSGVGGPRVARALIVLFATMIAINVGNLASDWHDSWLSVEMLGHVRSIMYERILEKMKGTDELASGQTVARFNKIPTVFNRLFEHMQLMVIPSILIFVGASVYLFSFVDRVLGIAVTFMSVVVLSMVVWAPKMCEARMTDTERCMMHIYNEVDDTIRNSVAVAERRHHAFEAARLATQESSYRALQDRSVHCSLGIKAMILPVIVVVLVVFAKRTLDASRSGRLKVAAFATSLIIISQLIGSITMLNDTSKDFAFAWASLAVAKRDFASMMMSAETSPTTKEATDRKRVPEVKDRKLCVSADNVSYRYAHSGRPSLKPVSFRVCSGERVAVSGPIGSGKTTLLKLVVGFLQPTGGALTIDGIPIQHISDEWMRHKVAYVPQTAVLFDRTLYENITYGMTDPPSRERLMDILRDIGIDDIVTSRPGGLDFRVGKGGGRISGGQRQLVYCARVLLQDPQIILLDEPTASLDTRSKQRLVALLDRMIRNRIVMMVTHDEYLLERATRTIRIRTP